MSSKSMISVVIPVYNEAGNSARLHGEIVQALKSLKLPFEIIFVDDGSMDGTLDELKAIRGIRIINLNRNYGQATALDAGFKAAKGDIIISLDGDGQNDPADIPLLLSKLEEGRYDIMVGWRKHRQDNRRIQALTRIGHALRRLFIGNVVHDSGCTLRAYKREAVKSLDIGGEMHRYVVSLLRWKGFKIGEVVVNHRQRGHGVSKYGMSKMVRGFIDLVYIWFIHKYSQRPLHLFGYLSVASFFFGIAALIGSAYSKIAFGVSLSRNGWFLISMFCLLTAIIFFSFGIVIDLLIRIQLTSSPYEKRYHIREVIET